MCSNQQAVEELLVLAEKHPLLDGVRQARWLLRAMAQSEEPIPSAELFLLNESKPKPPPSPSVIRSRASTYLSYLKIGDRLTLRRYESIVEAGRAADAIEILTKQDRLAEWHQYQKEPINGIV